jgi:ABC-type histidine transport system ATPase subunit
MIKASGITKSFASLQVLKGIDLEIQKGEIVSIVGACKLLAPSIGPIKAAFTSIID